MVTAFLLPIVPHPCARPRFSKFGHAYTDAKTRAYKEELNLLLNSRKATKIESGPIELTLSFFLQKPKSVRRLTPCVRPDIDNYVKPVMDALNGRFWSDDGQVVYLRAVKSYSNSVVGIQIIVKQLEDSGTNV